MTGLREKAGVALNAHSGMDLIYLAASPEKTSSRPVKTMSDDFPDNNLQKVFLANIIMTHTASLLSQIAGNSIAAVSQISDILRPRKRH